MGNWRTVEIEGSIAPVDLDVARAFVNTGEDWDRFHPLCNYGPSLCGLGDWVAENIAAIGEGLLDLAQQRARQRLRRILW